jgi:hypothetical protein
MDLGEIIAQPSDALFDAAGLLRRSGVRAGGDGAKGERRGRWDCTIIPVARGAAVFRAFETPVATVVRTIRAFGNGNVAVAKTGRVTLPRPPDLCYLPRNPRFHCRIRVLDRVQRSPNVLLRPASVDRQWMAALIPGAVFVLRVKMRLRPENWQPVSGIRAHRDGGPEGSQTTV